MVGYGSNFVPPELSPLEVRVFLPAKEGLNYGLLRILITLGEVGLTFLPFGAAFQTGVALAGATAQTGLDIASGQVSPVNIGIQYGAALIPGIGAGVKNLRHGYDYLKRYELVALKASERQATDLLFKGVESRTIVKSLAEEAPKYVTKNIFSNTVKQIDRYSKYFAEQAVALHKLYDIPDVTFINIFDNIFDKAGVPTVTRGAVASTNAIGTEEDIRKIGAVTGLTEIEVIELNASLRFASTFEERASILIGYYNKIGKLDELAKISEKFVSTAAGKTAIKSGIPNQSLGEAFKTRVKDYVRALKHPNSEAFNQTFVQKVQLVFDGNDAGRAPIEFVYRKAKEYFRKILSKIKPVAKIAKNIDKVNDAFVKSGGTLVNSNVIMGYKVVADQGKGNLVQISFYPFATRSRKNPQGKHPVYVFATDAELKLLRRRGMSYYLSKWATSKNGRGFAVSTGILKQLFGDAQGALAFLNIQGLKNILSLASNISGAFFTKGIKNEGIFTAGWRAKFIKSFSRNWKNRLGRFTGRVVLGGAAELIVGKRVGSFIGRELQRVSSGVIIPKLTGKNVTTNQLKKLVLTSVTGNVRRAARRRQPNNFALKALANKRKGGIIQRIPGSFTGGQAALSKLKFKI